MNSQTHTKSAGIERIDMQRQIDARVAKCNTGPNTSSVNSADEPISSTVKAPMSALFRCLKVGSRSQAILKARQIGLLPV